MSIPFDPRAHGAQCERCTLGPQGAVEVHCRPASTAWRPVPPYLPPGAHILGVAEAPGAEEERANPREPLVGKSGTEVWNPVLASLGLRRDQVALTNTILCRPSNNDYDGMEQRTNALNRRIVAWCQEQGISDPTPYLWLQPVDACRPLLERTVSQFFNIFALGGKSARSLLGTNATISAIRGGPIDVETSDAGRPRRIMPTWHPAYVLRRMREFMVLQSDLAKGLVYFEKGRLPWDDPWVDLFPTAQSVRDYFAHLRGIRAFDTETNSLEPMTADLRCLGISSAEEELPCWYCGGTGRAPSGASARLQRYLDKCKKAEHDAREVFVRVIEGQWTALRKGACNVCGGVAYGKRQRALNIPVLSVDGYTRFYSNDELEEVFDAVRDDWLDYTKWWCGHNSNYYDRMEVERLDVTDPTLPALNAFPVNCIDNMLLTRLWTPERQKALGVVGSLLTFVHAWKADNEGNKYAYESRDDRRLHVYCSAGDAPVTAACFAPLMERVVARGQTNALPAEMAPKSWPATRLPFSIVGLDHERNRLTVDLHRNGMPVNPAAQARHAVRLRKAAKAYREKVVAIAEAYGVRGPKGKPFNPNSSRQVADLFYTRFGWTPISKTATGQYSTSAAVIREHLADASIEGMQRDLITAILDDRGATKSLGTFVNPAVPSTVELSQEWRKGLTDEDLEWIVQDESDAGYKWKGMDEPLEGLLPKRGFVQADGRVHASWNSGVVAHGRVSCSGPNLTNVPGEFRDIYGYEPGSEMASLRHMVGGDLRSAHLTILANHARIPTLLEAARQKYKLHSFHALRVFGDAFFQAPGWKGKPSLYAAPDKKSPAGEMYHVVKVMVFAGAYFPTLTTKAREAAIRLLWNQLRSTQNDEGEYPFLNHPISYVEAVYGKLFDDVPEWKAWWQREIAFYDTHGYVVDPVIGRRFDFLDGKDESAIVNAPVLAGEVGLMLLAEPDIRAALPAGYAGPGTGIINQCHDSATTEGPKHDIDYRRGVIKEAMTRHVAGWELPIDCDLADGLNFSEA